MQNVSLFQLRVARFRMIRFSIKTFAVTSILPLIRNTDVQKYSIDDRVLTNKNKIYNLFKNKNILIPV